MHNLHVLVVLSYLVLIYGPSTAWMSRDKISPPLFSHSARLLFGI